MAICTLLQLQNADVISDLPFIDTFWQMYVHELIKMDHYFYMWPCTHQFSKQIKCASQSEFASSSFVFETCMYIMLVHCCKVSCHIVSLLLLSRSTSSRILFPHSRLGQPSQRFQWLFCGSSSHGEVVNKVVK